MASFDFTASDGTTLEAYDSRWDGATTSVEIRNNRLQVITANEVQRAIWFANGQGADQACQFLVGPRINGVQYVAVQKNGSQVGYEARFSGTNVVELRRNGSYLTEGSISGGDFSANAYTIKISVASGQVRIWAALGAVADAQVSGTLLASNNDGSPLTGGYPGAVISAGAAVGNTGLDDFTDFVASGAKPWLYYANMMSS